VNFISGFAIAFAYLHKLTAGAVCVMFALIGIVNMIRNRRIMLRYVFLAAGFFLVFFVEMGFHYVVHDDMMYRPHVYYSQVDNPDLVSMLRIEPREGILSDIKRLFWTIPLNCLVSFRLGFYYWFIFPAIIYCLIRKRNELWAPLLWWFMLVILLSLVGGKGYRLPFYTRQTLLYTVPGIILLAGGLMSLRDWAFLSTRIARKLFLITLGTLALLFMAGAVTPLFFKEPIISLLSKVYTAKHTFLESDVVAIFCGQS